MCGESFRHLPDQGKNNNYTLVVFIQLLLNYKKKTHLEQTIVIYFQRKRNTEKDEGEKK